MIFDTLKNIETYYDVMPELKTVKEFYDSFRKGEKPENSYILDGKDGSDFKVSISSYTTKPVEGAEYESHRKYIDVQIVASGREYIGWAPLEKCNVTKDFEENGDIAFYTSDAGSKCLVEEDSFMVLYPQDAHMPNLQVKEDEKVTKLVYKIRVK